MAWMGDDRLEMIDERQVEDSTQRRQERKGKGKGLEEEMNHGWTRIHTDGKGSGMKDFFTHPPLSNFASFAAWRLDFFNAKTQRRMGDG
jgi:hypothetical protein